MPSQPWNCGPAHLYLGVGPLGTFAGGYTSAGSATSGAYTGGYTAANLGTNNVDAAAAVTGSANPVSAAAAYTGGYAPGLPPSGGGAGAGAVASGLGLPASPSPPARGTYDGGYTAFRPGDPWSAPSLDTSRARPRLGRSPVYLGTCEETPRVHFKSLRRPHKTDWSCDEADDVFVLGEEALIFATINYYAYSTYLALTSRPVFYGVRGIADRYDRGTLLKRSGLTYPVWMTFPFAAKRRMAGMVPGYRFAECYVTEDSLVELSTRPKTINLAWHAIRSAAGVLFDHDMKSLPAPV